MLKLQTVDCQDDFCVERAGMAGGARGLFYFLLRGHANLLEKLAHGHVEIVGHRYLLVQIIVAGPRLGARL